MRPSGTSVKWDGMVLFVRDAYKRDLERRKEDKGAPKATVGRKARKKD